MGEVTGRRRRSGNSSRTGRECRQECWGERREEWRVGQASRANAATATTLQVPTPLLPPRLQLLNSLNCIQPLQIKQRKHPSSLTSHHLVALPVSVSVLHPSPPLLHLPDTTEQPLCFFPRAFSSLLTFFASSSPAPLHLPSSLKHHDHPRPVLLLRTLTLLTLPQLPLTSFLPFPFLHFLQLSHSPRLALRYLARSGQGCR